MIYRCGVKIVQIVQLGSQKEVPIRNGGSQYHQDFPKL